MRSLFLFQIKEEMAGCLDFLKNIYDVFGFTFSLKLSTRPEKFLGEAAVWDDAEKVYVVCMCVCVCVCVCTNFGCAFILVIHKIYLSITSCDVHLKVNIL